LPRNRRRSSNAGYASTEVVLAVPVGPPSAVAALAEVADAVVCVETTENFFGLSEWYQDFRQVSDGEVARLLAEAARGEW
jgi:putative phosphoribosyl transferase